MSKKFTILFLLIFFTILLGSQVFAADFSNNDLYISNDSYTINNSILGNVFAKTKEIFLDSTNNSVSIDGDLFVFSDSVMINSSNTESTIANSFKIFGNVFAFSDKLVIKQNTNITGDLYFYGKTLTIEKGVQIDGNIFVYASNVNIDSQIAKNAYINAETFVMDYDAYIFNDLKLNAKNASLNGQVRRNCNITSADFKSLYAFKSEGEVFVNSEKINFAGEIVSNANFNAKEVTIDESASTCLIRGNLNYSSKEEININPSNVLGEISYSKYKSNNNFGKILLNKLLNLAICITYILGISFIINKFIPTISNKYIKQSVKKLAICFGIGLGILLLIPIVIILLFILKVTSLLALCLLALYILLLLTSIPIFINILANQYKNTNVYLNLLVLSVIFWLINLIPYAGIIIDLLLITFGLGISFVKKDSQII